MKEDLAEKLLSKALVEYQDKYSTVFHLSPTFIFITRLSDSKIIEMNDFITQTLGFTQEEVIGKTAMEIGIWTIETRNAFYNLLESQGHIRNYETTILSKSDMKIDVLVNVEPIILKKKQCLLIIAIDITEKKRIERQQLLLNSILTELNKQDEFSEIVKNILHTLCVFSGFDSVAIRMKDDSNYPYFESLGMPENLLSGKNNFNHSSKLNCSATNPCYDCLCNKVLNKDYGNLNGFTDTGSYYCNQYHVDSQKPAKSKNNFTVSFFSSFALIPLKSRNIIIGLLQLNSVKSDFFSQEAIKFYEELGSILGIAFNRHLDEMKIKESEIQFRGIYENATIGIYRTSPDGTLLMANPSLLKMLGYYTLKDLVRNKMAGNIYAHDNEFNRFRELLLTNEVLNGYETEWKKSDGSIIHVRENAIVVKDIDGNVLFHDGTVEDITDYVMASQMIRENERRLHKKNIEYQALNEEYISLNMNLTDSLNRIQKMNKELLIAKEKAEESDKLKAEFLRNMSHEVRTPMNGIMGFADLMTAPDLQESEKIYYASFIKKSCQRLLNTITDIIDYSVITASQMTLNYSAIKLHNFLNTHQRIFRDLATQKKIKFEISFNSIEPDFIFKTDESKLSQIIVKLVENAIHFTEDGSVQLKVYLKDTYLEFQVSDTGIGIPYEYQSVIFDQFRKAGDQNVNYAEGAGLGLTIAKSYVELLNGELWLESEPNKGSVFCFTLPLLI